MATLRPPSAWADAQRAFHLAYDDDPVPFDRRPVAVSWVTRGELDPAPSPDPLWDGAPPRTDAKGLAPVIGIPHVFGGFLLRVLGAWRHGVVAHDGIEVCVTTDDGRSMSFTIDPDPAPQRRTGTSSGVLVGEMGMNAAACVEIDGQVIWPTMPPIERITPRKA